MILKTVLGIFPGFKSLLDSQLDYILEASTFVDFNNMNNNKWKDRAVSERLSDLFLQAVADKKKKDYSLIFKTNFGGYNKERTDSLDYGDQRDSFYSNVYFDPEENRMKHYENGVGQPEEIRKLLRDEFFNNTFGDSKKRKEVNIVFSDNVDDQREGLSSPSGKTYKKAMSSSSLDYKYQKEEMNMDDRKLKETDSEVLENLEDMRKLQKYFLQTHRVDLRELLRNYFAQDTEPEEVISRSAKVLEGLLREEKEVSGDIIRDYLQNRREDRIPDDFNKILF